MPGHEHAVLDAGRNVDALTARRGEPPDGVASSACTSPMSGRFPSSVTVIAVPGTGAGR